MVYLKAKVRKRAEKFPSDIIYFKTFPYSTRPSPKAQTSLKKQLHSYKLRISWANIIYIYIYIWLRLWLSLGLKSSKKQRLGQNSRLWLAKGYNFFIMSGKKIYSFFFSEKGKFSRTVIAIVTCGWRALSFHFLMLATSVNSSC